MNISCGLFCIICYLTSSPLFILYTECMYCVVDSRKFVYDPENFVVSGVLIIIGSAADPLSPKTVFNPPSKKTVLLSTTNMGPKPVYFTPVVTQPGQVRMPEVYYILSMFLCFFGFLVVSR